MPMSYPLLFIERACPWCGEPLELTVDPGGGAAEYVEDCQVCCAPILVRFIEDPLAPGDPLVELRREGD